MKTLYIDCGMGVAGDMLTAALIEAAFSSGTPAGGIDYAKTEDFIARFHKAGIPGVEMRVSGAVKQGITGTRVRILINGEEEGYGGVHGHDHHGGHEHDHHHQHHHHDHAHRSMKEITGIINGLALDDEVKADVLSVYTLIAEAEGQVHGEPAGEVHFHEVGSMDAVADVTAVCMLMHDIGAERIAASPVATGYGTVLCAHGLLPVPAPATAVLLQGMPSYAGDIEGELCTPTGAALVKHFAQEYSQKPAMSAEATGCGLGTKEFEKATCLRVFLGES